MTKYRWMASAVLAMAVAVPAWGQDGAKAGAASKPAGKKAAKEKKTSLKGEYGIMAKICELTEEQQAKVQEAVKAADADAKTQEAEYQKKLAEAQKALKDVQAQRPVRAKIVSAKVEEVLTPEQKAKYAGYRLYVAASAKYAKLALTKEQKDKFEAACVAMGGDADAQGKVEGKLIEVLTEEQKAKLEAMKAPAKPKGKAASHPASKPAGGGM